MLEKIMAYDWEDMIARIIEGLQNFVKKFNELFPKAYYNFEDPEEYEF
jgi:hypothetical protein